jgi:DNA-binding beta-propeller fold protein YncE
MRAKVKRLTSPHFLLIGIWLAVVATPGLSRSVARPVLLVVNQRDRNVSIIDPVAAHQIATVPEGETMGHGHEIAVSPDGRTAYLPIYSDVGLGQPGIDGHEMLVIDIPTRKVIAHVEFGHPVRPHCPVYDRVSGLLYVTTELDNSVAIVDPHSLKVVGTIPTGQPQSHMLTISHDGRRGYTSNASPSTVSVLDMNTRKTVSIIPDTGQAQRVSVSNDDTMVFVPDQTKPRLAIIDTSTNKIKTRLALPSPGYATTPTLDGRWLLVALKTANKLAVVDLKTQQVVRTIDVPAGPQEIVMRPDGKVAYVSCIRVDKVVVVDIANWTVKGTVTAGDGADGLAWAP